ncbi:MULTISPECIES: pectinesterase family protein [unclassified Enterococcus]|uniref:pectinesterase family protein n=1 Tax=unclassified Enterococcus TaxID=2608891 RepID=UPI0013EA643F|nr:MULTISPECIES: pectinesterase family protein [unclassified Enterococcus]
MKKVIYIGKKTLGETTDFETIKEGIDYFSSLPQEQVKTMFVKEGVYNETIESRLSNFSMIGLGKVKITGNRSARQILADGTKRGTFRSAVFFLEGTMVSLENLHIVNTAGPGEKVGQAVALYNSGNQVHVKNCRLTGHQDTLCTGPLPALQKDGTTFVTPASENPVYCKQIYDNCLIEGTVDFIFGGAEAYFVECQIRSLASRKPGYITAASTPRDQKNGYIFRRCQLTGEEGTSDVYLGRPWRPFAKTVFEQCEIGNHIHPDGWDNWGNEENEKTAVFVEIHNRYSGEVHRPSWVSIEM